MTQYTENKMNNNVHEKYYGLGEHNYNPGFILYPLLYPLQVFRQHQPKIRHGTEALKNKTIYDSL